jgi:hypothetical protein
MRLGWKVFIPITLVWIWSSGGLDDVAAVSGSEERPPWVQEGLPQQPALLELLKGMAVTGRYLFARKITIQYPEEKTPQSPLPRPARAAPLPERRGALHRLQAVRGGVPGAGDHHRIGAARRRHAPHHALRHRPDQVHLLRLLRGGLPGRRDRRDAHASSTTARSAATSITPSRCCWPWATATKRRSRPTARRRQVPMSGCRARRWTSRPPSSTCSRRSWCSRRCASSPRAIPVHAALFLVLAFFTSGGLWLLLQAEFLAIALVLVYVGAVMVLFLFVVMMLDINLERMRRASGATCRLGGHGRRADGASRWCWCSGRGSFGLEAMPAPPRRPAEITATPRRSARLLYTITSIPSSWPR